ncbi:MAG: DUF1329 domain-containing protein [Moraxellaceae bacterium]|nr:DUF1329 domain-containing protein [Moraxellaceae bacterium]
MRNNISRFTTALAVSMAMASTTFAAVSADEAAKLKTTLMPLGGEKAGNAAGTIPAWSGGITKPPVANYKIGQHHPDPFASDKPLFTITAQNMNQYADQLSEGQKALFRTYPQTYKMIVYPSRRTQAAPQFVYDNTFKCATTGKVKDWGIDGCIGGIPFPIPSGSNSEQALQIVWNHIIRFRGQYVVRKASEVAVQRNGSFSLVTSQQEVDFRYYNPQYKSLSQLNNILFYYYSFTTAPARLAGGAVLVHETLDQRKEQRQAWGYNAGQRRVRQAPNLSYDTPIAAADGLRTADDTDIYNGAPDKYEWKLIGKKEVYIPYNSYKVDDPKLTYKQLLMPGHPNPDYLRYELHRVWVVEGTLEQGQRHIYSKRRFYIDEDSWSIAIADQYDGRGDLWRVSMAYLKNYYEVPTVWTALDVFHDLQARRYHVQQLDNEEDSILDFSQPSPGDEYFTPAALRRRGTR